jgi:hypothetical protein
MALRLKSLHGCGIGDPDEGDDDRVLDEESFNIIRDEIISAIKRCEDANKNRAAGLFRGVLQKLVLGTTTVADVYKYTDELNMYLEGVVKDPVEIGDGAVGHGLGPPGGSENIEQLRQNILDISDAHQNEQLVLDHVGIRMRHYLQTLDPPIYITSNMELEGPDPNQEKRYNLSYNGLLTNPDPRIQASRATALQSPTWAQLVDEHRAAWREERRLFRESYIAQEIYNNAKYQARGEGKPRAKKKYPKKKIDPTEDKNARQDKKISDEMTKLRTKLLSWSQKFRPIKEAVLTTHLEVDMPKDEIEALIDKLSKNSLVVKELGDELETFHADRSKLDKMINDVYPGHTLKDANTGLYNFLESTDAAFIQIRNQHYFGLKTLEYQLNLLQPSGVYDFSLQPGPYNQMALPENDDEDVENPRRDVQTESVRNGMVGLGKYGKKIAQEAYRDAPQSKIGEFELVKSTPTIKAYKNGKTVIVGIRGTKNFDDWIANAATPIDMLSKTKRVETDRDIIKELRSLYPDHVFHGAAHSLGGAVLDVFLGEKLLDAGESYNPSVNPFFQPDSNERTYNEGDPLLILTKPILSQDPRILQTKPMGILHAHSIQSFQGSGHHMDRGGMWHSGINRKTRFN